MATSLPYINSPGTIDTAFRRMREAATPPRFTNDFVATVLQIKGGTGSSLPPFFKKLGFLNSDGTPTPLYDRFRNEATSKHTVAEAVRAGYKPLFAANEYANKLSDNDMRGLILQVTGLEKGNRVAQLILQTLKKLLANSSFDGRAHQDAITPAPRMKQDEDDGNDDSEEKSEMVGKGKLRLSYTIALNLPATTNIEVFNAIFRSLKENLLLE